MEWDLAAAAREMGVMAPGGAVQAGAMPLPPLTAATGHSVSSGGGGGGGPAAIAGPGGLPHHGGMAPVAVAPQPPQHQQHAAAAQVRTRTVGDDVICGRQSGRAGVGPAGFTRWLVGRRRQGGRPGATTYGHSDTRHLNRPARLLLLSPRDGTCSTRTRSRRPRRQQRRRHRPTPRLHMRPRWRTAGPPRRPATPLGRRRRRRAPAHSRRR